LSRIRCAWVIAALLLLMVAADASGHAGSVAFWRIAFDGVDARSQILVSLDDVGRTAPDVVSGTGPVPVARLGAFGDALLTSFVVDHDGAPAPARILDVRVLPSGLLEVQVVHRITGGEGPIVLRATFHRLTDDTHRVIGRVERHGVIDSLVFDVATPEHALRPVRRASWRDAVAPAGTARAMLLLGIEHILTGYDHLVFLACLLVPGGTWRSRVAIVTAFTVAHSLTLVLVAMKVVTPPARFVEPAIAMSIAYVAIENLISERRRPRWPTALGFGLVHGLGFAGMLDVLDLPVRQWLAAVLAFNLGVEIGQLAVVAVALPLIVVLARSSWHGRVVQYTSVLVLGLAFVWFVERLQ
jgi:hydrogenase/urease accessory protein HupE